MKWLVLCVALLGWGRYAYARDSCVSCHLEQSDASLSRQVKLVADDVHGRAGLSCVACHGGDPNTDEYEDSMDPKKGYVGVPKPADMAAFCTRCHADAKYMRDHAPLLPTDQGAKYAVSRHAAAAAKNEKGAATCTSCHRAHGIQPSSDPRASTNPMNLAATCGKCHSDPAQMSPRNLPADEQAEYEKSVHWRAVRARNDRSAPVCHDCHGNHSAATPQPNAVMDMCGRCHVGEYAAFQKGKHVRLQQGFRACVECHSNHRIEPVSDALLSPAGVCYHCHGEPGKGRDEAQALHAAYTQLDAAITRANDELAPLANEGLSVSAADEELRAAREKLIASRKLVHTDDVATIQKQLAEGDAAVERARAALAKAHDARSGRRAGGIAFALFALFTSLTLALKVSQQWAWEEDPDDGSIVPLEPESTPAPTKKPKRRKRR